MEEQLLATTSMRDPPAGPRIPPAALRVLVVDDHALVREGIRELLSQQADMEIVGEAGTAAGAIESASRLQPDVALVDIRLPDRSGLAVAAEMQRDLPEVRVLIVSAFDDAGYVVEALLHGAAGYLLKTASGDELAEACRTANAGAVVLDAALARGLARRGLGGSDEVSSLLTSREVEVAAGLARGFSNKQLAADLGIGVRTIEGHITELFAKLGVTSRTEAALWAVSHGLAPAEAGSSGP